MVSSDAEEKAGSTSAASEKKQSRKSAYKPTMQDLLTMIEAAATKYAEDGGDLTVLDLDLEGVPAIGLVIKSAKIIDGAFVLA